MIDEVRKQTELRIEQEKKIGVQEEKIRQLENEIVILKEDNLRSDLNFSQTEVSIFSISIERGKLGVRHAVFWP